ncbi:hypothetical protein Lal_00023559 [Lupinus albus]|nr:hypothetical protein Lal_00023559 [Lupinus albus]
MPFLAQARQSSLRRESSSIAQYFTLPDPKFHYYPYRLLWKEIAPLKVINFVWRLFQNRIPTKEALLKRGVTFSNGGGTTCPMWNDSTESTMHLFSSCSIPYSIWQVIYKWLNISVVLPLEPINHFLHDSGMVKDSKSRKVWNIIWLATVCALWLSRNDFIFNNVRHSLTQILESERVFGWIWIKNLSGLNVIIYSDWLPNPLTCLNILL